MNKRSERAFYGPSWIEVVFGAVLSVLLGIALGAAVLMLRPVVTVKELPKERPPGVVYYVEGARDAAKAKQALMKRRMFAEGGSVSIAEDEINALITPTAPLPPPKPAPKPVAEKPKTPGDKSPVPKPPEPPAAPAADTFVLGSPNFRLRDGEMQVGVPVTVNLLGSEQRVIVQARGGFAKRDGVFVFDPATITIGSFPVDGLPFVSGYVRGKLLATQTLPDDVAAAWRKLAAVSVEGNALKLTMP